jgi:hypothetical protein
MNIQKFKTGITDDFAILVNYKEENKQVKTTKIQNVHHIQILDRSGSMSSHIDELIDNVQKVISELNPGDMFSVIWFSSSSECRVLLKGAQIYNDGVKNLLDSIRSTLSTTCFSIPFQECLNIVNDLESIMPISISLFTDGQPVVNWSIEEEKKRVFTIVDTLKNRVLAINTIGYGNYYDQTFLREISEKSQYGILWHSSEIKQYHGIFNDNFDRINDIVKEPVHIEGPNILYLNRKFAKLTNTQFHLDNIDKEKNQFFLFNDSDFVFEINGEIHNTKSFQFTSVPEQTIANFHYALAYCYYYQNERLKSLDILKYLGDKFLIDSHLSSFTYDETAEHLSALKDSLLKPKLRYSSGKCSINYLPKDDALCVMDILRYLQNNDTYYVPLSKNIEQYKRIGKKSEDSFNLFEQTDEEIRCRFSDFVFNKEHLNMSIRFEIPGIIKINPAIAKKNGLETEYKTSKYRNFTIIKDGNVNIPEIEILINENENKKEWEYVKARSKNMIFLGYENIDNKIYGRYIINLKNHPIVNRQMINNSTIENVFGITLLINQYEAYQKMLNFYMSKVKEKDYLKKTGALKDFTTTQIQILEEHGLDKNMHYKGVEVTRKLAEQCDSYQSRTLEFYFAGISSLPKVEDLFKKLQESKSLTISLEMLNRGYEEIKARAKEKNIDLEKVNAELRDFLIEQIAYTKQILIEQRMNLAIQKMAKVLSGDWYTGLKTDDKGNFYYEKDGYKMIVKTTYTTEYF